MKSTKKALRAELKDAQARLGKLSLLLETEGSSDERFAETKTLWDRVYAITAILDPNPIPQIDSSVR